eukprot:764134-Hanusia_phi.AAC.1
MTAAAPRRTVGLDAPAPPRTARRLVRSDGPITPLRQSAQPPADGHGGVPYRTVPATQSLSN